MIMGRKPVGTVCYLGGVPALLEKFVWSWGQMIQYNAEIFCNNAQYVHYDRVTFSDHAPARNALAKRFQGDWICYLDTDHQFEPDVIARLYRLMIEHDLDVVTGLYRFKSPPYSPIAYQFNPEGGGGLQPLAHWPDNLELLEVASAGAGCLMIQRRVLNKIKLELQEEPFDRIGTFSEDHSFFKRLHKLAIKAYLAPHVEAQHLTVVAVDKTEEDYTFSLSDPFLMDGFTNNPVAKIL